MYNGDFAIMAPRFIVSGVAPIEGQMTALAGNVKMAIAHTVLNGQGNGASHQPLEELQAE